MQLHIMLENTAVLLPFLEVPWYANRSTEIPYYLFKFSVLCFLNKTESVSMLTST